MAIPIFDDFLYLFYGYINLFFKTFEDSSIIIPIKAFPEGLVYVYLILLIYVLLSKNKVQLIKRFFIWCMFLILSSYQINTIDINIYFLDVNQGDATIIKSQDCTIVIDAFNYVTETLKGLGENKIDYLFITHHDLDHVKELDSLIKNFKVGKLITNPYHTYSYKNTIYSTIPNKIECNRIKIDMISPLNDYINDNDNSLILLITMYNQKFLFLGDASKEVESDILSTYPNLLSEVTILKVSHHGSKTSTGTDFIKYVNPMYAIISVGRDNHYGMPHKEVLDVLKTNKNTTTLRTDQMGTIIFTLNQNKITYTYMKP
jgi:competence protein ComEC